MTEPLDPEHFDDFDDADEDGEIDDGTSVAIVATQETISVRVEEVKDDRTPDGMVCMATFLGDRMIARAVVPPEAIIDLQQREVLKLPVQLGLAAVEDQPGLQCRLFALVPATAMDEPDEADEPWAASVPRGPGRVSSPRGRRHCKATGNPRRARRPCPDPCESTAAP